MTDGNISGIVVRRKTAVWLIGAVEDKLSGSKLPSNKQVLSLFFYQHKTLKQTVRDSARVVIREVATFWDKARIPIRQEQHAIAQLELLHQKWKLLQRNANRHTDTQRANEANFVDKLEDLFDIAHTNALKMMKIQEDRDFLLAQREKGRRGCMGSVDKVFTSKEQQRAKRAKSQLVYKQKKRQEQQHINELTNLDSSTDAEETLDEGSLGQDEAMENIASASSSIPINVRKRSHKNVITPLLAAALDRTKLSDRKATFVIAATVQSLGHNLDELNVSRSSIRRARASTRTQHFRNLKQQFQTSAALVVHWDGKLLPDLTGKTLIDRLPVIVSGAGVNQLLGVPKLSEGTGEAQASAVARAIEEWGLRQRVSSMCFDTTASNTGRINGACVLLEQKLGKDLLYLACRHHMFELLLAAVFNSCMGLISGPDVAIFKRFQQAWPFITQGEYETASSVEIIAKNKDSILEFAIQHIEIGQPRDDYKELLELAIVFIGGIPPRGVHFMAPGAMHHARWLAKAIYALKIWLFQKQFSLTAREERELLNICIFVVVIYFKAWFTAPFAASAPNNDFQLLKNLVEYERENAAISSVACKKLEGHLWYLSEELVGLSFFDDALSVETKREMVLAINEHEGTEDPPKRLMKMNVTGLVNMTVANFVTKNTSNFFRKLGIQYGFIDVDPELWNDRDDYRQGRDIVHQLKVVNDIAEQGVALIEEYNSILTNDEDQKQYLLQIVQDHRKRFPNCNKRTQINQ